MYESFYKLRVSPFQLSPDPLFYYDSDTHRHGLIKLRQSVRNGNTVTVVSGAPGTGKTELMRKFISEFDTRSTVIASIPLTSLRSSNILDYIASAFGVVNMGFVGDALWSKNALIGKIQQQVSMDAVEGKKFVVIIDNAESLSKSCYKKLLQLCAVKSNGAPLIQCFLFGESSIIQYLNLKNYSLNESDPLTLKLEALSEQDSRRYVEHRLIEAGWQGDPELTDNAFTHIHQISEGVPWHINLLCHRVMLQSFLLNTHVIDEQLVNMFANNEHLEKQVVSGSDVAMTSNVVNLNSKTGKSTKGTSFIFEPEFSEQELSASQFSETQLDTFSDEQNQREEIMDSISHFFSDPLDSEKAGDTNQRTDEMPFSIEDVEDAFSASIGEICEPEQINTPTKSETDLFFPEVNTRIEVSKQESTDTVSIEQSIAVTAREKNKLTANILQRIFPKTVAMMDEYSQPSTHKSYPVLDIPGATEVVAQNTPTGQPEQYELNDEPDNRSDRKSSFQIATRASIVTSLVITLVMWVISDTRTRDVQSLQNVQFNARDLTSIAPTPFQNPDDISRSRAILGK